MARRGSKQSFPRVSQIDTLFEPDECVNASVETKRSGKTRK